MQLTFITASRLDLFERTFWSVAALPDSDLITSIRIVDDASPGSHLRNMLALLRMRFPLLPCELAHSHVVRGYTAQMEEWRTGLRGDFSFHCEDDWEFKDAGPVLTQALDIMAHEPFVAQVAFTLPVEAELLATPTGTQYWIKSAGALYPYTANPSVVRTEVFAKRPFQRGVQNCELDYGKRLHESGYKTAYLAGRAAWHTGAGRSAFDINNTPR